jgi:hypothetical protein
VTTSRGKKRREKVARRRGKMKHKIEGVEEAWMRRRKRRAMKVLL